MQIRTLRRNSRVTIISATRKDIRNMNTRPRFQVHKDLKVIATIVRSMEIEHMSVDPSLNGHPTSKQR